MKIKNQVVPIYHLIVLSGTTLFAVLLNKDVAYFVSDMTLVIGVTFVIYLGVYFSMAIYENTKPKSLYVLKYIFSLIFLTFIVISIYGYLSSYYISTFSKTFNVGVVFILILLMVHSISVETRDLDNTGLSNMGAFITELIRFSILVILPLGITIYSFFLFIIFFFRHGGV